MPRLRLRFAEAGIKLFAASNSRTATLLVVDVVVEVVLVASSSSNSSRLYHFTRLLAAAVSPAPPSYDPRMPWMTFGNVSGSNRAI